jgi:hypothetical protein
MYVCVCGPLLLSMEHIMQMKTNEGHLLILLVMRNAEHKVHLLH